MIYLKKNQPLDGNSYLSYESDRIVTQKNQPLDGNILFESEKSCIIKELVGARARTYGFIVQDKVVEVNEKICRR
jgi:hypothetical protein